MKKIGITGLRYCCLIDHIDPVIPIDLNLITHY